MLGNIGSCPQNLFFPTKMWLAKCLITLGSGDMTLGCRSFICWHRKIERLTIRILRQNSSIVRRFLV